jgi:hypothetical protein
MSVKLTFTDRMTAKVNQARPITAPVWALSVQMRLGERHNKIPTYRKSRHAEGNGQRATGNGQRATGNGQRATGNGQRATGNGQRAIILTF